MADISLWLPLGTAVIGAVAVLAGNAFGPMFGAQGEHKQWLRNKRAELLESFHAVLDEAQHDASGYSRPFSGPLSDAERSAREADSAVIFSRLTSAAARAELYTSPALARVMSTVAYDYQVIYASTDTFDWSEWNEVHRSWSTDVGACTHLIRKELRVD